jgi:transposase-like protein
MAGHGSKSARQRDEAIEALLTHRSIDEAARAVGIAPNTLRRWMKEPDFDAAYREARRERNSQWNARLQGASPAVASALIKLALGPSTPEATRLRAIDSILDRSNKAIETDDIQARLTKLERTLDAPKGQKG